MRRASAAEPAKLRRRFLQVMVDVHRAQRNPAWRLRARLRQAVQQHGGIQAPGKCHHAMQR
jgi:hypothetical protein